MTDVPKNAVMLPELCPTHRVLLVKQTGYGPSDPWQALELMTQVALFQAATCDSRVYEEAQGEIKNFSRLGCLACRKPDAFGSIVDVMQRTGDLGEIKKLGESWVNKNRKDTTG